MENGSLPVNSKEERLRFFRSPIHDNDNDNDNDGHDGEQRSGSGLTRPQNSRAMEKMGYRYRPEDTPWLRRNDDATNLEVFYDLFFAACLNLFNRNQRMDSRQYLSTYVGFYSLMWTTWFVTGAFDVRFLTDSVFERCCRAVHLAVLIGFIIVSPNFDTANQDASVFRSFSIVLMISRLCLALEYASIFFQARKYRNKWHLALMAGINLMNGVVYFFISTRFEKGTSNNRLFISWYALCATEIVSVSLTAISYPILSFQGTPLIRRISLLTLIIFGEGITIASSNVTDIIDSDGHTSWSSAFWGIIVCNSVITYLAFMFYFDQLQNFYLSTWRTHVWTLLHFPLQLAMTLFTEGCAQFLVFWKAAERDWGIIYELVDVLWESVSDNTTDFSAPYRVWLDDWFAKQPPLYWGYRAAMNEALDGMRDNMSREDRIALRDAAALNDEDAFNDAVMADPTLQAAMSNVTAIMLTVFNVGYQQYGMDYGERAVDQLEQGGNSTGQNLLASTRTAQAIVIDRGAMFIILERMRFVFQYTFICSGGFLAGVTIIYCIGRTAPWTRWAVVRVVLNLFIGLCVGLVALLAQFRLRMYMFLDTPWPLPPLAIVFLVVLVLFHIPEEKMSLRAPFRWLRRRKNKKGEDRPSLSREKKRTGNSSSSTGDRLGRADTGLAAPERASLEDTEDVERGGRRYRAGSGEDGTRDDGGWSRQQGASDDRYRRV